MDQRMGRLHAGELATAGVCALWVAALTPGVCCLRFVWALAFGAAVLPLRTRPGLVASVVLVLNIIQTMLGASLESPGPLAPSLVALYGVGRYAGRHVRRLVLPAYVAYTFVGGGWSAANLVFGTILFGGTMLFGWLVARRTAGARSAEQILAEEAATDPAELALAVVAEERERLAIDVVKAVRDAVTAMAALSAPDRDPGPEDLAEVQQHGRAAIAELRRLLGLLRVEVEPAPATPARPARRRVLIDGVTALGLGLVLLLEVHTYARGLPAASVLLTLGVMATAAFRRTHPATACLAASAGTTAALLLGTPLVPAMSTGVLTALLAWSAAGAGSAAAWSALAALAIASVASTHLYSPGNGAMDSAVIVLAGLSGYLWAERSRVESRALEEAGRLRAQSDELVRAAVREERLRVARELHDVASHAVGVMVLQAGAAIAQWDRDPSAAQHALAEAHAAGSSALAELDSLDRVLNPQVRPEAERPSPGDALAELDVLTSRLRTAGVTVDVSIDEAVITGLDPRGPQARTIHRVVQEALTNAVRHAPGSGIRVSVHPDDAGSILVEVHDDGRGAAHSAHPGDSGFGLVGVAERVRALGGESSAGPRVEGGFSVRARLPLPDAPRSPAPEEAR